MTALCSFCKVRIAYGYYLGRKECGYCATKRRYPRKFEEKLFNNSHFKEDNHGP